MLTAAECDVPRSTHSLPKRPPNAVRARLRRFLMLKLFEGASLFSTEFDVEFLTQREAGEDLMLHARLMGPISASLLDEYRQVFGALRLHDVFDACVQRWVVHVDTANSRTGTSYSLPRRAGW